MVNRVAIYKRACQLLPAGLETTGLAALPVGLDALRGAAQRMPARMQRVALHLSPPLKMAIEQQGLASLNASGPPASQEAGAGKWDIGGWKVRRLVGACWGYVLRSADARIWVIPDRGLVIHCARRSAMARNAISPKDLHR